MTARKADPEQRMGGRRRGGTGGFSSGGELLGPPRKRGVKDEIGRVEGGASRAGGRREALRTPAKGRRQHPRRSRAFGQGTFKQLIS